MAVGVAVLVGGRVMVGGSVGWMTVGSVGVSERMGPSVALGIGADAGEEAGALQETSAISAATMTANGNRPFR